MRGATTLSATMAIFTNIVTAIITAKKTAYHDWSPDHYIWAITIAHVTHAARQAGQKDNPQQGFSLK